MRESGYYPPGAEFDPRAPYNEPLDKEVEIKCTICLTLCNKVKIKTLQSELYGIGGEIDVQPVVQDYLNNCNELTELKNKGWEYTIEEIVDE